MMMTMMTKTNLIGMIINETNNRTIICTSVYYRADLFITFFKNNESLVDWFEEESLNSITNKLCICPLLMILQAGCKCGGK